MSDFLTNRSTILDGQKCPRSQWLQYYYDGTGITRKSQSVPLATGSVVHEGVAAGLQGASEDDAAGVAIDAYAKLVADRGLDTNDDWTPPEQSALAEALVRVHHRECLPTLKRDFDILSIEADDCQELAPGIGWQFRLDAALRSRVTGGLVPYSLKTMSEWRKNTAEEIRCDMQGLSEAWGLERATGEECEFVKMDFLMKGKRDFDDRVNARVTMNHLIRGWVSNDVVPKYAWRWKWQDAEGGHSLSAKKWQPFYVWQAMGVREWLDMLWAGDVQPEAGDPKPGAVIAYPPIFRNPDHILRWHRQTIAQAERTQFALTFIYIRTATGGEALDIWFPQYTAQCFGGKYHTKCQFYEICHEGGLVARDPLGSGEFIRRDPHHTSTLDDNAE